MGNLNSNTRGEAMAESTKSVMGYVATALGIIISLIVVYNFTVGTNLEQLEASHEVLQNAIISNNKILIVHEENIKAAKESIEKIDTDLSELQKEVWQGQ